MRISPIANQNFRALQINNAAHYSSKQADVADDILIKASEPQENYNGRSTIKMLEEDYEMNLYTDPHVDSKSINLYFAEKAYLNGELSELQRLTPIGTYDNDKNSFDISEIENRLIDLENGSHKGFIASLATIVMIIGMTLIPLMGIISLATSKNASKAIDTTVTNVKTTIKDSLNNVKKDTVNFFDAMKK